MASSPAPNGSYLQQADPQNFPANATGAPPPNNYQTPATTHTEQAQAPEVSKDEVGWYFVEQYYTTLNKTPERLHLFYNKKSTMVWGTEGESLPLAHGRADIQEKIGAHEFKDCKVRVSNVDSQASASGGIVIQVLGEMSNNGAPHRKFSQTFFLAEQPNGYYVLNDIFRYLKDDDDIEEGDEYEYPEEAIAEAAAEAVAEAVEEAAEEIIEEIQEMSIKETTSVEVETPEGDVVKVEETVTMEPAAEVEPEVPTEEETPAPVNGSEEPVVAEEPEPVPEEKVEEPVAEPEPEVPVEEPAPAPVPEEKPAPPPVKATPPPPAVPAAPPRPKTWANLVAGGAKPIVPQVAPPTAASAAPTVPATAAAAAAAPAPAPATAAPVATASPATATASSGSAWQTADSKRHSRVSATPGGQTSAYVKNVTEGVTEKALRDALTKYGNLKSVEMVKGKNCAFVEFETPAAFSAANAANPHHIGGSNVLVEERRRNNPPYGRGGMANRGDGRPAGQGGRGGYAPRDGQRFGESRGGRGGRGGFGGGRGGMKTATAGN